MADTLYAGIELGGTKCICVLARSHNNVIEKQVVDTTEPDATVGAIERILARWNAEEPIRSLGIASFGPIDLNRASPTWGFITTTTKQRWSGTDLAGRLQRALGGAPTAFDTDVNGAALAELRWGAAGRFSTERHRGPTRQGTRSANASRRSGQRRPWCAASASR